MEQRVQRLIKWSLGEPQSPFKIEFYPTNRCNLSCSFCWKKAEKNPDYSHEVPVEPMLRLVAESAELGTSEWFLCGAGEPLVVPQVTLPVMDAIKVHGMKGILNTNGYLATMELVRHWVAIGWEDLHFSIDSFRSGEHDRLRGRAGSFVRVDKALQEVARLRQERGDDHPYLVMITVVTNVNYPYIEAITEYALARKVDKLIFKELIQHPHVQQLNLNRFQYWRLKKSLARARTLAETGSMRFEFQEAKYRKHPLLAVTPPRLPESNKADRVKDLLLANQGCSQDSTEDSLPAPPGPGVTPRSTTIVNDLALVPCFEFWLSLFIYPNGEAHCGIWSDAVSIKSTSLRDVWYGDYFSSMRTALMQGKVPEMCRQCARFNSQENQELQKRWRSQVACL